MIRRCFALRSRALALLVPLASLALAAGTGCDGGGDGTGGSGGGTTTAPSDCAKTVSPGDDDQATVQAALIEANDGDVICFAEGTFKFKTELSLTVKNVTLRGAGQDKTTWDFSAQDLGANGLLIKSDGVTVEDFMVKNTPGDGIRADAVTGITFKNMSVIWDADASETSGAYGLYPVGSDKVVIDGCTVKGARDAGIYVGQSTNILVANSEAYGNVAGIEIENSTDAEVVNNKAYDNTAGILVFNLPGLPVVDGKRAKVHKNVVENNNLKNFGVAGTVVAKVPKGIGVMLLATDDNEIADNEIKGNSSTGVMVVSYLEFLFGQPNDPKFDKFPEGNWIHDNTFENNGQNPHALIKGAAPGVDPIPDIVWDGCANPDATGDKLTNCISGNTTPSGAATYGNADLCGEPSMLSTDPAPVTCEYEPLPPQK